MIKKSILLIVILFIPIIFINAQMVKGTVFETREGERLELPAVNIHWAGSAIGTSTDENGKFELIKPAKYSKLVFSFVGYKTDTLIIDQVITGIEVFLIPGEMLDEISIIERAVGSHISRLDAIQTEKITGVELGKAACCNLAESFETNASVDAYYANAATGAKQIRLLGLDGQYVQMLTENIPNLRGLAMPYGLVYIPGTWMEAINVSKGTSSVKNGYESITGQINIEYLKPNTADHFFFNALANTAGKRESNLVGSVDVGDRLSTLILAHVEDNSLKSDFQNDGFLDHPLLRQYNFLNRWRFGSEHIQFRVGVKAIDETRTSGQVDFDPDGPRGLDRPYGIGIKTERYEVFAKLAYLFNNRLNSNFGSIYSFNHHTQDSYFGMRDYKATEQNLYINLMFQTDIMNKKHKLTSGLSLVHDNLNESLDGLDMETRETVPGIFTEYGFNPNPRMTLLGGIRLDFNSIYGMALTPRLHARYDVTSSSTLRLSAGKGYRTPHVLAEQNHFLASSRRIVLQEDFDREEAWNYGINLTQYVGSGPRQMTISLEAYRTSFINQVIMDLDSSVDEVRFYNLDGRSFSNNYQAEISYDPFRGLDTKIAFRYTDVRYDWNGELTVKPLVSKYKGLFNLSYMTPLKKWQVDYTIQLNGPGRIPFTTDNPVEYQLDTEFPAFTIMNAQLTKYFKTWNIYVGAENLTDFRQDNPVLAADKPFGEHFDASMIWGPVDGRKIYVGVRFGISRSDE